MIDESPTIVRMSDFAGGRASGEAEADGKKPATVPLLTLEQLREQSQTTNWVVKRLIPAESLGLLYGPTQSFKSFIATDLAMHVAHGLPWLGQKTRQGPVIIVAGEGGSGLWKRIVAWHQVRRVRWAGAPIHVVPIPVDLGSEAILVREAAKAQNITPALVIVDTLSQTFRGEENSAQDVAGYLQELGLQFRACWQCAVVVVHHTGHNVTERPRGSSAFASNTDFTFGVTRDGKEMLATLENIKQKDGEPFKTVSFNLHVHKLGTDPDGDDITTLVASALDDQGQVLEVMEREAQRGRGGHRKLFLDLATNGSEEKHVRTVFYESVEGDADTRKQAFHRARKWALSEGLIEIVSGRIVWPTTRKG